MHPARSKARGRVSLFFRLGLEQKRYQITKKDGGGDSPRGGGDSAGEGAKEAMCGDRFSDPLDSR